MDTNQTAPMSEMTHSTLSISTNGTIGFTAREHQTMELIARGFSSKRIAHELTISEDTVESHRRNILKKLGVSNMMEAVAYAFRNNLIK